MVDTPVANAAAKAAQAIAAGLSGTQEASVEVLLESIRSSRMYPKFVEMLEAQNVRKWLSICSTDWEMATELVADQEKQWLAGVCMYVCTCVRARTFNRYIWQIDNVKTRKL